MSTLLDVARAWVEAKESEESALVALTRAEAALSNALRTNEPDAFREPHRKALDAWRSAWEKRFAAEEALKTAVAGATR